MRPIVPRVSHARASNCHLTYTFRKASTCSYANGRVLRTLESKENMSRTIRTKELENIAVAGITPRDYPDFCDAYNEEACWKSTGEALTDV